MNNSPAMSALTRRSLLKYGLGAAGAVAGASVLGACGSSGSSAKTTTTASATSTTAVSTDTAALMKAARAEGKVTTVAIGEPDSYFMPVIEAFEKYSGIDVDAQNTTYLPTLVLKDLADASTAKQPPPYDAVEMTQSVAAEAMQQGLLDPYVSSQWRDIPSTFKDADGAWSASYFGLVSFVTNIGATDGYLPKSWDELANSPRTPKASFAMLGDPRTGQPLEGGLGLLTVMSAALANGGSVDNVEPGLALLGELADKGIFDLSDGSSLVALPDDAGTKATPINALYSFDLPLARVNGRANLTKVEGAAPADGLIAGFYPQAVAAGAQHANAARLWIEFLQSDEGAAVFIANGALPTRHAAIRSTGSKELRDALPPDAELNAPVPSIFQINAAQATVDEKWTTYLPVSD